MTQQEKGQTGSAPENSERRDNGEQPQQGQGQAAGTSQTPAPERSPAQDKGPSNAGDAGFGRPGSQAQDVSDDRLEQMSHADGSSDEPNPDV